MNPLYYLHGTLQVGKSVRTLGLASEVVCHALTAHALKCDQQGVPPSSHPPAPTHLVSLPGQAGHSPLVGFIF